MTTRILGLSFAYHDSAAALVVDGELVAAASEERFTRKKHTSAFPARAIQYCLHEAGITPKDLTHVVFYEKPFVKFDRILTTYTSTWPRSWGAFRKALPVWMRDKLWVKQEIADHLQTDAEILFCEHHLSHAASTFLASPFEKAAILTLDGVGEWETSACGIGEGNSIRLDRHIDYPHSLGLFYSALTAYLGFRVNDAEWKVMGLAPYGEPRYVEQFRELIDIAPDGSFALDMRYYAHHISESSMLTELFETHFGQKRRDPNSELAQFHKDIARSGQAIVEEAMTKIALDLHQRYGVDYICIGGGVGLNSVGNFRIIEKTPFKDIFIQPAAGDDGAAIGAALYVANCVLGLPRKFQMKHAYFGPGFDDLEVESTLRRLGCQYQKYDDAGLVARAADLLMEGQVIGWCQGRMEFGPRALGSRSILADPRRAEMKDVINAKVKYREWFRPFAPSVCKESAGIYFDLDIDSPFMLLVPKVRDQWRDKLPAITHQDGTGRVQTVEPHINPRYYALIKAFGQKSGVDVVLNTSFNVRGEPVVCTPEDAVRCYEKTGIDHLVMGNFVVSTKRDVQSYSMEEINALDVVPQLRIERRREDQGFAHAFGSFVVFLLVAFAGLELATRGLELVRFGNWSGAALEQPAIYQPRSLFKHALVPGSRLVTERDGKPVEVQINSHGLRGPETTVQKPAGRLRVACLGGSTTFDTGGFTDAGTWPRLLEAQLRKAHPGRDIEVLNFGVPGYTAADNVAQLALDVGRFAPDVVVLFQGYNDLSALSQPAAKGSYADPTPTPGAASLLHDHSLLVRRLKAWRMSGRQQDYGNAVGIEAERKDELPPGAPEAFAATVRSFVALTRGLGAQPVLVTQVYPYVAENNQQIEVTDASLAKSALYFRPHLTAKGLRSNSKAFNDLLRKAAADQGATLVDAARQMAYTKAEFIDDIHFSASGSEKFANVVGEGLRPALDKALGSR